MSVGKIAVGVFLGNLATAILSLMIYSLVAQGQQSQSAADTANAAYNAMIERNGPEATIGNAN